MNQKGLARETVARAALDLLDEVGLDGLTVRRLAAQLGVKSPALYWHFRSKQELLDEMCRQLLEPDMGGPRADESWQEWLTRRAHQYRRMLLSHRDGARLVAVSHPGMTVGRKFEAELKLLTGYGFTPAQGLDAISTVSFYTTGFVLQEQASLARQSEVTPEYLATLTAEAPTTMAAVTAIGTPTSARAFTHGLRLIIDGITTSLTRPSPTAQ
ncbi:TetR family transcriptional regulator [Acrocarpospora pleiomorpha]|uniref:TetR family transcriptional regulator n=1 Tax=Acrocarpospora pleiomorpha TaxID=90975 RepID=A0A5M3XE37_9ACTN|nr:TetR/AcrR family transcriptional regulator C-terminal domain-containing protein [Acrocarpospora pleiomorpha]GES19032.1 TetR family transcriptional regulator [Acrocarpospora pleiomorpha]